LVLVDYGGKLILPSGPILPPLAPRTAYGYPERPLPTPGSPLPRAAPTWARVATASSERVGSAPGTRRQSRRANHTPGSSRRWRTDTKAARLPCLGGQRARTVGEPRARTRRPTTAHSGRHSTYLQCGVCDRRKGERVRRLAGCRHCMRPHDPLGPHGSTQHLQRGSSDQYGPVASGSGEVRGEEEAEMQTNRHHGLPPPRAGIASHCVQWYIEFATPPHKRTSVVEGLRSSTRGIAISLRALFLGSLQASRMLHPFSQLQATPPSPSLMRSVSKISTNGRADIYQHWQPRQGQKSHSRSHRAVTGGAVAADTLQ